MSRRTMRLLSAFVSLAASLISLEFLARGRGWGLPTPTPPDRLRRVVVDAPVSAPTLVVLGDSIPWGYGLDDPRAAWPVQLGHMLAERGTPWRVVDASIPGETSLQGWARWRRDVLPWQPQVVMIAFGLNDGHLQWTPADGQRWRRFPRGWGYRLRLVHLLKTALDEFRRPGEPISLPSPVRPRLEPEQTGVVVSTLVRDLKQAGIIPCILTPSPITRAFHPEWPSALRDYQGDLYEQVRDVLIRLSEEEGAPLVDIYRMMWPPRDEWYIGDGIHLAPAGHNYVASTIFQGLGETFQAVRSQ